MGIIHITGAVCACIGFSLLSLTTLGYQTEFFPRPSISTLLGITLLVLGLYLINRRSTPRVLDRI